MTSQSLSDFIAQLRSTGFEFPLLKEHRVGTVYIMPHTAQKNELKVLGAVLEEQLSLTTVIENIQHKLEDEIAPFNRRLVDYVDNLHKIFSGYAAEGPYSTRYFNRMLSTLKAFQGLVELYAQRDKELVLALRSLVSGSGTTNGLSVSYGKKLNECVGHRTRYTHRLQKYYQIFDDFLHQESDKKQGVQVITRSEQCLMNLTSLLGQSLYLSRSMEKMLDNLNSRLLLAQVQVQYN